VEVEQAGEVPRLHGDRGRLEEVLLNLARNALEALAPGGRVRLTAQGDGAAHVRFTVEDDGPGILPSVRAELFKPFVTTKAGGTGLGLAIARKVVIEHGGEIGVGQGRLPGACFWIRLPSRPVRFDPVRRTAAASA
jgi:signal transduction histidine kinase